ncbi:transposase [Thermoplasma volcanium]
MVKVLFLQSLYNLVDEAMEKEIHNRIDFISFSKIFILYDT